MKCPSAPHFVIFEAARDALLWMQSSVELQKDIRIYVWTRTRLEKARSASAFSERIGVANIPQLTNPLPHPKLNHMQLQRMHTGLSQSRDKLRNQFEQHRCLWLQQGKVTSFDVSHTKYACLVCANLCLPAKNHRRVSEVAHTSPTSTEISTRLDTLLFRLLNIISFPQQSLSFSLCFS
jgi:hypothetical protein